MELTATDLDDLATFFGRRIDLQLTPVPPPRSDAEARQRAMAWAMVLEEAQEAGRLSALVHRIAHQFPDDATLQSACRLLTDPGRAGDRAIGLVLIAGATAFVGAAGVLLGGFSGLLLSAAGSLGAPPTMAALGSPQPDGFAEWAVEEEVLHPVREESAPAPTRCAREAGGLVGYWYAGGEDPGTPGTVLAMDSMINVRAEYPGPHNAYDSGTTIQCLIKPGDRVRLSAEPIPARGGLFWVPMHSGDLTPRDPSLYGKAG